jgi:hypothetical protein
VKSEGRPAAHCTDHGQLDLEQQRDDAMGLERGASLHTSGPGLRIGCIAGHPVRSGAEIVPATREQDDPQGIIDRSRLECVDHLAHGSHVERSLPLGPVDGEAQHTVPGLDHHAVVGLLGHAAVTPASTMTAAAYVSLPTVAPGATV